MIPVEFMIDAIDLGYLDGRNNNDDLKKGAKLNMPLWLAKGELYSRRMVRIEKPLYFTQRFADSLLVEPKVVNLKAKCKYWYIIGYKLCNILNNNNYDHNSHENIQLIIQLMQKSLYARKQEIINQSNHYRSDNYQIFKSYLSFVEENLFNCKHEMETFVHKWKNDIDFDKHIHSNSMKNKSILGKRKRSQM